ncbi:MAG TPA: MFS transporter [Chitinophagaceae bacterium]|nr:MFS transporter [Chitinophagaceae bacterium]
MEELKKSGRYRWKILSMLFFATTINYMDRSIMGVLGPTLQKYVFHWTNIQYSYITNAFMVAYASGLLIMGGIIDRIGTRLGYAISIAIWSFFSLLHTLITRSMGWIGFVFTRFGLGFGESGNFPACIKTVGEWFPVKERAFATGIFNAGSNVGAIFAPLIIPLFVANNGKHWQYAFCITFIFSLTWLICWLKIYKKPESHPKVSSRELEYIVGDSSLESPAKIAWIQVIFLKETWAFAIAKITDAAWWFYLFWGSFFLHAQFGLNLQGLALPLIIIYVIADAGSISGGWLSSHFIKRGWTVNKSRKITLLICALIILPVIFATQTKNEWISVLLIGIAAGGHQAWSANVFTLVSDIFPKKATASVVGIGGMVGAIASIIANFSLGRILDSYGKSGYFFAFLIVGSVYLVTLFIVHLILPVIEPLNEDLSHYR